MAAQQGNTASQLVQKLKNYRRALGQGTGMIPTIFRKAQNAFQDPAKLTRLKSDRRGNMAGHVGGFEGPGL